MTYIKVILIDIQIFWNFTLNLIGVFHKIEVRGVVKFLNFDYQFYKILCYSSHKSINMHHEIIYHIPINKKKLYHIIKPNNLSYCFLIYLNLRLSLHIYFPILIPLILSTTQAIAIQVIHSFIPSFIHSFSLSFIHSFIHPFVQNGLKRIIRVN